VVVDGETGWLVPIEVDAGGLPTDPHGFARALATRVNDLLADSATAGIMGKAGRHRVLEHFSWPTIATRTVELYQGVLVDR